MTQSLDMRIVLVTGANGGLGTEFVRQALDRGATKVYAAARTPRSWDDERVVPIVLDLTDPASIAAAASVATDVDVLVNNAGIAPQADHSLAAADDTVTRAVFETNFFGTLAVSQAFAPVLATNGGGTILTILSAAAWLPLPTVYAASKAAMWAANNGLRTELAGQGTTVIGLHVGMVDTAMASRWDVPKASPEHVVVQALDAVGSGALEVLADEDSRGLKSRLGLSPEEFLEFYGPALAGFDAASRTA